MEGVHGGPDGLAVRLVYRWPTLAGRERRIGTFSSPGNAVRPAAGSDTLGPVYTIGTSAARALGAAILLGSLAATMTVAGPARADLYGQGWIELETPGFTIWSRLAEARSRELAESLELFRQVVSQLAGGASTDSPVPTRILFIESENDWRALGGAPKVAGFFLPTLRANFVVLRDYQQAFNTGIVQHEYVHFVLRNQNRVAFPKWYDEGLAEVLSTVSLQGEFVHVGAPPAWSIQWIQHITWMPLRKIVDPEPLSDMTGEERGMFYAESWALVHYLLFGGEYRDSFKQRLDAYIQATHDGADPKRAFEAAFDTGLSQLDRAVRKYLEGRKLNAYDIPADRFAKPGAIHVREAPLAEVAVAIGYVQLFMGELDRARDSFEHAMALDADDPRPHAGLGEVLKTQKRFVDAVPHFKAALRRGPDDPASHLDWAEFLLDRAGATTDADARVADIELARRHIEHAWKLDPSRPETYAAYGDTYLALGDDPARAVEMLEGAWTLVPSSVPVRVSLAEAYLAVGRDDDARAMARSVIAWSHGEDPTARRARDVLAMLDALAGRASPAAMSAPASQPASAIGSRP